MKKFSIEGFSILGLILMCVSAVTAAISPSKNSSLKRFDHPGSLTFSNDNAGLISCTPTASILQGCNVTILSGTTAKPGGSISKATTVGDLAFLRQL